MGTTSGDQLWPEGVTPTPTFLALINHIQSSRGNIFVTGRAGTGKSTLLRAVVKILDGEAVIGAPTGIAALNVGGETLHALFRLPQSLLLDGDEEDASPRPGQTKTYCAVLTGEFENRRSNANGFPPEVQLTLKEGARVVFIRNDRHRRWVNGTTGVVKSLGDDEIEVTTSAGDDVTVSFETWTKRRRIKVGEELREEELGSIAQLPVRLGWAVAIHKSQGMTLDRVFLNTPRRLFASGQCYVALSRARSLAGLRLLRPLNRDDIFLSADALGYRDLLPRLDLGGRS